MTRARQPRHRARQHRSLRRGAPPRDDRPSASPREIAAGWRHADAHDVLAIVEIAADRPLVGAPRDRRGARRPRRDRPPDAPLPARRAPHAGRSRCSGARRPARQWLGKAEKLRAELARGRRHRRARPRGHARAHPRVVREHPRGARARARRTARSSPRPSSPDRSTSSSGGARSRWATSRRRAPRWSGRRCRARSTGGSSPTARRRRRCGRSRCGAATAASCATPSG